MIQLYAILGPGSVGRRGELNEVITGERECISTRVSTVQLWLQVNARFSEGPLGKQWDPSYVAFYRNLY